MREAKLVNDGDVSRIFIRICITSISLKHGDFRLLKYSLSEIGSQLIGKFNKGRGESNRNVTEIEEGLLKSKPRKESICCRRVTAARTVAMRNEEGRGGSGK